MSILCHPLGSHFPVGRIEISNNFFKTVVHALYFFPHFGAFFLVVVDHFPATGARVFTVTGVCVIRLGLLVHLIGVGGLAFAPAT